MKYLTDNLKAFGLLTRLKIKRILMFKVNLISQTVGMFINNFAFLMVWWLLLKRFGNINGYGFKEIILIEGYSAFFYAWFYFFLAGTRQLSDYLNQDRFIDLQMYPVSPLTVLVTKSGTPSQLGDLIQGSLLLSIYSFINPGRMGYVLVGVVITIIGLFGVQLALNSLLFYFPRVLNTFSDLVDNIYIGASMYPSRNFEGGIKYLLYGILLIPLVSFPVETVRGVLDPSFLIYSLIAAIIINVLGYFLWKNGIKRVESGSSGGVVE